MAQIAVSDQEVAEWEPKIAGIVEWFGQLQAVDVAGAEPAIHARGDAGALRADVVAPFGGREALMAQVPETDAGFVRVPKITTGADAAPPSNSAPAAAAAAAVELPEEELATLAALDIRVGVVTACERHPDADSLYVEAIDVGEPEPRTIVSGLVKYVPLEAMQGRRVVVLCNLKPRNMRGVKSHGMVLAASDAAHENVEPISPPAGAAPGARLFFGPHAEQGEPMKPNQVEKKKVWEAVAPGLRTDANNVATYKGLTMQTAEGPATADSLAEARIA